MRAQLKGLDLEPDPATVSADPAECSFLARMYAGRSDSPGRESFDITVRSPEWLAEVRQRVGGIYRPRHHLVVNFDEFDKRVLETLLSARVRDVEGSTWAEIGERLTRMGYWEFEDYRA